MTPAEQLDRQQWSLTPSERPDIMPGTLAGARLARYGIIRTPDDLLATTVGTVIKTGVSAYERIA